MKWPLLGDSASETSGQGSLRSLAFAQGDVQDVGESCRSQPSEEEEEVTGPWSLFLGNTWSCVYPCPLGQGAWSWEPASRGLRS